MYWDLLKMLRQNQYKTYIVELFETTPCDSYYNLSERREEIEQHASKTDPYSLQNLLTATQTKRDEEILQRTMIHYRTWHIQNLMKALNWNQKIRYYTRSLLIGYKNHNMQEQ
jgi:hypothetical protein